MSETRPRVPKFVFSRIHISFTKGGTILRAGYACLLLRKPADEDATGEGGDNAQISGQVLPIDNDRERA